MTFNKSAMTKGTIDSNECTRVNTELGEQIERSNVTNYLYQHRQTNERIKKQPNKHAKKQIIK